MELIPDRANDHGRHLSTTRLAEGPFLTTVQRVADRYQLGAHHGPLCGIRVALLYYSYLYTYFDIIAEDVSGIHFPTVYFPTYTCYFYLIVNSVFFFSKDSSKRQIIRQHVSVNPIEIRNTNNFGISISVNFLTLLYLN